MGVKVEVKMDITPPFTSIFRPLTFGLTPLTS